MDKGLNKSKNNKGDNFNNKTRGPYAFYELLRSLQQSNKKFLADILTLSN